MDFTRRGIRQRCRQYRPLRPAGSRAAQPLGLISQPNGFSPLFRWFNPWRSALRITGSKTQSEKRAQLFAVRVHVVARQYLYKTAMLSH